MNYLHPEQTKLTVPSAPTSRSPILLNGGGAAPGAAFQSVELREAPKEVVLSFSPGQPISRQALVHFRQNKRSFSSIVDLSGRGSISRKTSGAKAAAKPISIMHDANATGKRGRPRLIAAVVITLCVLVLAATWDISGYGRAPQVKPSLVSVAFVGFSTNASGTKCLQYRIQNDNAQEILLLAELRNCPPGSEQFVRVGKGEPQTIDLTSFSAVSPYTAYVLRSRSQPADTGLRIHPAFQRPTDT